MYAAQALLAVSGILLAVMLYFMTSDDPFAVVNHPWQSDMLHLHVLSAPPVVFLLGIYAWNHAFPYLSTRVREGRGSGWTLVVLAAPMILSGYLIQVSVSDGWRKAWIVLHLATSILWIVGMTVHGLAHWRARRRARI